MTFEPLIPPRRFRVGLRQQIELRDCGRVQLEPNEQVTFVTSDGREHDFAAKEWGYYVTPSLNHRLRAQGFKTALVRNSKGRLYVMTVAENRTEAFDEYLHQERQQVVEWLDERGSVAPSDDPATPARQPAAAGHS
jgi:hypothetical protein